MILHLLRDFRRNRRGSIYSEHDSGAMESPLARSELIENTEARARVPGRQGPRADLRYRVYREVKSCFSMSGRVYRK